MTEKITDKWQTPTDLFNILDKGGIYQEVDFTGFNFDIDLCATKENSKCFIVDPRGNNLPFFCKDYLTTELSEFMFNSAFMNPPYSNPRPFIEKAWEDSKYCKIVCLMKIDPSTRWWSTFWQYDSYLCPHCNNGRVAGELCTECKGDCGIGRNGPKPGCEVIFFPKRIKFDPPKELIDSGEVWDLNNSSDAMKALNETMQYIGKPLKPRWVQKCKKCCGRPTPHNCPYGDDKCLPCKGEGYTALSGPSFPSCLLVFDRRVI